LFSSRKETDLSPEVISLSLSPIMKDKNIEQEMTSSKDKLRVLTEKSQGDYLAFLYDCDGTLAHNMHLHKAAYIKVAAIHGVELDPEIIDETAGWPTVKVVEEINKRYGSSIDPVTFAKEKTSVFVNELIIETQPIDFVVDHLKNHAGKIRIGVVSGGSRSTVNKTLAILGLHPFIEVMVCAGETEKGKPYADPFLRAAELLNVDPKKCLVFEDGDPGVKAAEAAGMDWIRIDKI
jgi:HAD superfamily hydrolase (TIGR01509 family)